tara:strand:- start:167 stop:385 length:219 start_codon:yes stop_codon:yes gene_type:complete
MANEQELIDIDAAIKLIGDSCAWYPTKRTIRNWRESGKVSSTQIGGRIFFNKTEIIEMVATRKEELKHEDCA